MSITGPGGDGSQDDFGDEAGGFNDINITPLTDIFLVLLIIFMVTSSVIVNARGSGAAGLEVNLPSGSPSDVAVGGQDVSVAVLADGRLVYQQEVVTLEELTARLAEVKARAPDTLVVVQADEGVPHGKVVEVMETAKKAGLGRLAIGVRQE